MKYIIDIPEIPKNDKQRWVVANGTPYEERPHGEWLPTDEMGSVVRCSRCSFRTCADVAEEEYNFCPNCGADMREGEASDKTFGNR